MDLSAIYPIYLASCILNHDLQTARYVRKRILINHASSPETDGIWRVIVDLIQKNYTQLYQDLDGYGWSDTMQLFVERIKQDTREKVFRMMAEAFTSIELQQASSWFGLSSEQVLEELIKRGWTLDQSTQLLYPIKPASTTTTTTSITSSNNFEKIADIILNLEKF
ncbi:MAG: COP9 signalosome [Benjaminiella poitrasii]|nr:MAG: COP9 signalosome [Benjaminiella poitrasii]